MTISFYGVASTPADNSSYESTATPAVVTPPAGMQANDLCIFLGAIQISSATRNIGVATGTDGQTWTSGTINTTNNNNRMDWCVFNGTWSVNPRMATDPQASNGGLSAVLVVFRSSLSSPTWAIDVSEVDTHYTSSPTTITAANVSPITSSNVSFAWFSGGSLRTVSGLTAGWTQPGGIVQWRNTATTSGQRVTLSAGYKIQTTNSAVTGPSITWSSALNSDANIIVFTDGDTGTSSGGGTGTGKFPPTSRKKYIFYDKYIPR